MLYPDFNDLVAYKDRHSDFIHPSAQTVKSAVTGNHHSPFRGQGLEFDSVREYIPGDDIRSIDWRVTARTGSPHLKLFQQERERHIVICVDMNAAMRFGTRNTFKSVQAARIAALLGWCGIAQHDRVSACLFGDVRNGMMTFPPARTRKSFYALLKTLAEPPTEQHQVSLENTLQQVSRSAHSGALIYIISDFMNIDDSLQNQASLIRLRKKCDVVFISINDPADKSITPVGTVGFCANEKEKFFLNTDSISGRNAYAAQWKSNREHLHEAATRFKIPLIELTTESDVVLGMKNLARRRKR